MIRSKEYIRGYDTAQNVFSKGGNIQTMLKDSYYALNQRDFDKGWQDFCQNNGAKIEDVFPSIEEIEKQVEETENRGKKFIQYLEKYKGQSIYNEIALAIEYGYQLRLEEEI